MNGTCKLCLRDGVELQRSHLLPAAIYRAIRGDIKDSNPNPWLITPNGAVQTSRQDWAHLLCLDCEQRFSKNGEQWVFKNGLKADGSFQLSSVLASKLPDASDPKSTTTKVYLASHIPEVDIPALTYFAASMFWRASVHPWKSDKTIPVKLGPYREAFRQYLMGLAAFPENTALWVVVRNGSEVNHVTHYPVSEKIKPHYTHRFPMPGFIFTLIVGQDIADTYRSPCFVRGNGNPLIVSGVLEQFVLDAVVKMLDRSRA